MPRFPVLTISRSLLKFMAIELMMPPNDLILCHPLILCSIFPSIRVVSNESPLAIMWPTYWSFSFSISPSNEHSGFISFRIDWFDLLAVQGILKSLLNTTVKKSSVLRLLYGPTVTSAHDYWKNHSLTRWTFVSKMLFMLFSILFKLP